MKVRFSALALLSLLALSLLACDRSKEDDPAAVSLVDTWDYRRERLTGANKDETTPYPAGYLLLTFTNDGKVTTAFRDSTTYTGTYTLSGKTVTRRYPGFSPVVETVQAVSTTTLVLVNEGSVTQTRTFMR